jgi:hypothetical protein
MAWTHPDTAQEIYLIEDVQLRTEIGRLIGRIASSHHWDIDDLVAGLGDQFNSPSAFPAEWSVDPVKIACLLRCADASHINDARAPLFLYALIKRQGISLSHWRAQNRIMGPSIDNSTALASSILYTSSRPFEEHDAQAWWIAHDAIVMIDKELRSANALLKVRARQFSPEFQIQRVTGADSLIDLSRVMQIEGWTPCKAEPHVSNVESLVRELGGEKLYGSGNNTFEIVVRELIQNARDAVVARRFIDPDFAGEIFVGISESDGHRWLTVEDDGIGMSQRVMTGPLLDFGNSFWKSNLISSEFPGLRSSKFRSIGRFGIGFYSIFMIADQVEVASKGWDKGLNECNTLFFNSGVSLRPILKSGRPKDFGPRLSTRLRLRLNSDLFIEEDKIEIKLPILGAQPFLVTFQSYISSIAIGLDVKIYTSHLGQARKMAHGGKPFIDPDAKNILHRISFLADKPDAGLYAEAEIQHRRLRRIKSRGRDYGVAAISTSKRNDPGMMSLHTIGGLAASLQGRGHRPFIGYIDHKPDSARRGPIDFEAPREAMSAWATEQLQILEEGNIGDVERCIAGLHACDFGADPINFGVLPVVIPGNGLRFVRYHELAELAKRQPIGIFKSPHWDYIETHHSIRSVDGSILVVPLTNGKSLNIKMANNNPEEPNSIAGCIHRSIIANGRIPKWSIVQTDYQSPITGSLELLCASSIESD